MPAIVRPRNASSDTNRAGFFTMTSPCSRHDAAFRRATEEAVAFARARRYNTAVRTLGDVLSAHARAGDPALYEPLDDAWVRCHACGHECAIPEGAAGACKVRFNRGGTLMVPWGYVAGAQCDPIEKKPFFHVEPGSRAFSFGMLGCDFTCGCCQNWVSSQALRDPAAGTGITETSPEMLVQAALHSGARALVSTYNEPLITTEWAVAVFKAARAAGLLTGYVSNGHGTPKVIEYLAPWVDFFKIDLKGFDDLQYRNLAAASHPCSTRSATSTREASGSRW